MINFISLFVVLYCVYQLGSLAGIYSERAGTANIATEGNMIVGAVVFALLFQSLGTGSTLADFLLAVIITVPLAGLYMMLLGILTNRYYADHIVAGTGMNLLAPALMLMLYWVLSPRVSGPGTIYSIDVLSDMSQWALVDSNGFKTEFNYMYLLFLALTILIVVISFYVLNKTTFGLRLKSSGENPYSLETSGVSVKKMRYITMFISGIISSLAGIIFVTKGTFFFTVNGSGFLAIGIMIMGQYKISGTVIGSLILAAFIGLFEALPQIIGTGNSSFNQASNLLKAIPFILPLIGLCVFRNSFVPNTVGQNFKKDQR